jgi:hypothetical protein
MFAIFNVYGNEFIGVNNMTNEADQQESQTTPEQSRMQQILTSGESWLTYFGLDGFRNKINKAYTTLNKVKYNDMQPEITNIFDKEPTITDSTIGTQKPLKFMRLFNKKCETKLTKEIPLEENERRKYNYFNAIIRYYEATNIEDKMDFWQKASKIYSGGGFANKGYTTPAIFENFSTLHSQLSGIQTKYCDSQDIKEAKNFITSLKNTIQSSVDAYLKQNVQDNKTKSKAKQNVMNAIQKYLIHDPNMDYNKLMQITIQNPGWNAKGFYGIGGFSKTKQAIEEIKKMYELDKSRSINTDMQLLKEQQQKIDSEKKPKTREELIKEQEELAGKINTLLKTNIEFSSPSKIVKGQITYYTKIAKENSVDINELNTLIKDRNDIYDKIQELNSSNDNKFNLKM